MITNFFFYIALVLPLFSKILQTLPPYILVCKFCFCRSVCMCVARGSPPLLQPPGDGHVLQRRNFLPGFPNPFKPRAANSSSRILEYSERRILGLALINQINITMIRAFRGAFHNSCELVCSVLNYPFKIILLGLTKQQANDTLLIKRTTDL